jgi:hypothetical protein
MANEWNCPINGDWSTVDVTQPPWVSGIAVLTHEQVLFVKERVELVISAYVPKPGDPVEPTDSYVQGQYNILVNYEQAVNGETFAEIKKYDPAVNTLGINAQGIIQPEPPVEEPTQPEQPIVEPTPEEGAGV